MSKKSSNFAPKFDILPQKRTKIVHLFITLKTQKTMAKQSGIHQIKGKIGEMSYYRTKGVSSGIIRSINQGLSERVKSGDEYANTRLNNSEFKNANSIATAAFNSVNSRKRGMMRNFAVAQMTKRALEDIKQGSQAWGVRQPVTELDALICDMLENYAKDGKYDGKFGTFTLSSLTAEGVISGTLEISAETIAALKEQGINGIQLVSSNCLAGEIVVDNEPRLFAGHAIRPFQPIVFPSSEAVTVQLSGSFATPSNVGMSPSGYEFAQEDHNHGFYMVISILPFRQVGSQRYTLQELCTYVAIPIGQIPE